MYYYKSQNKKLFSLEPYTELFQISEKEAMEGNDIIYFLHKKDPYYSRRFFSVSHPTLLFIEKEGLNLLQKQVDSVYNTVPEWINKKIKELKVASVNTAYINWQECITQTHPKKWRINIAGLGDVGSTLLIGLRLLGRDCIEKIGIYDRTPNKLQRWEHEINQIHSLTSNHPHVYCIDEEDLFDCDMFVFCIAGRIPNVGEDVKDVRMFQLEENSKIITHFSQLARKKNFKGIFAVVSDPVDLLCKVAFKASNSPSSESTQEEVMDFNGLASDQIRGYGLGVMHARAIYYAQKTNDTFHYCEEGRAFGPHGEDLIIANSIINYNEELSIYLTEKAKRANLEVRSFGFKPYVAPALSSAALSILATIRGEWHYSATYMGNVYMGAKNRLNSSGTEIESLELHPDLLKRLKQTYHKLGCIL